MAFDGLINRASNISLDVRSQEIQQNGARLQQWDYNATQNQRWEFQQVGGGWFWLRNEQSGKALDVRAQEIGGNGAVVQQWDYTGAANQQWQQVGIGGGWFWLRNRQSGKALDVHLWDIAKNGARVQQWDYTGGENQHWKYGGDAGRNRLTFGPFEFDSNIPGPHVSVLMDRHRFAVSRIGACGNLNASERQSLIQAYQRPIRHSVSTKPGINAEAYIGGSQIWINFQVLFPNGPTEIAQTLIHEMMHCAGFTHPLRRDPPPGMSCARPNPTLFDCPFDNGPYYGTPPLRAEMCIAGSQSDLMLVAENASSMKCTIDGSGVATVRRA